MSKKGSKPQRPAPASVPAKRASALAILLQRQNLLAVHRQLLTMQTQMGRMNTARG